MVDVLPYTLPFILEPVEVDSSLAVAATITAQPLRGRYIDSSLALTIDITATDQADRVADAVQSVVVSSPSSIGLDGLIDADMDVIWTSLAEVFKTRFVDSDLSITITPTTTGLRGRFIEAELPVTAVSSGYVQLDGQLVAELTVLLDSPARVGSMVLVNASLPVVVESLSLLNLDTYLNAVPLDIEVTLLSEEVKTRFIDADDTEIEAIIGGQLARIRIGGAFLPLFHAGSRGTL